MTQTERIEVENFVGDWIQQSDPDQLIRVEDFQEILYVVGNKVLRVMEEMTRTKMDDLDKRFIQDRTCEMVRACLDRYDKERSKPTRFTRPERVVCNIGGPRQW